MAEGSQSANGLAPAFQHTIAFWLLIFLAGGLFVPCALLPVYVDYGSWRAHHARVQARLAALAEQAQKNEAVIAALRTDPAVNERVLARDLGYVPPDQEVVTVFPGSSTAVRRSVPSAERTTPAAWSDAATSLATLRPWEAQIEQRLPRGSWLTVFTDGPSRRVLLIMSGALLITALVCFPARRFIP